MKSCYGVNFRTLMTNIFSSSYYTDVTDECKAVGKSRYARSQRYQGKKKDNQ